MQVRLAVEPSIPRISSNGWWIKHHWCNHRPTKKKGRKTKKAKWNHWPPISFLHPMICWYLLPLLRFVSDSTCFLTSKFAGMFTTIQKMGNKLMLQNSSSQFSLVKSIFPWFGLPMLWLKSFACISQAILPQRGSYCHRHGVGTL